MDNINKITEAFNKAGYTVTNNIKLVDTKAVYDFMLNEAYWAQGMPKDKFETAIANSLCFGTLHHKETIGFARVITDKATFAYLCDVFVFQEHRAKGLGKFLIDSIVNHPDLQGLRRWSLATMDAHGLYTQFGFSELSKPERWMEKYNPYIVQGS